jgi:hypothetical protein
MTFDTTFRFWDVLTPIAIAFLGWAIHRMVKPLVAFVSKVQSHERRIEDTAEVVDQHSDVLRTAGWTKAPMKPVSQKRRQRDDYV